MITREVLRKLLEIEDLPTLPQVVNQILTTVEDESASSQDLTAVLENDHAISTRILRMANSAFYGLPSTVDSIRRAVVLLGFDTVKMMALTTSVLEGFSKTKQAALDPTDFWMHSLGTAKAGQVLAKEHCPVPSPDVCFTVGLLHDIGKFLLALALKDDYMTVCEKAVEKGIALHKVEKAVFGLAHSDVGGWITKNWNFPQIMVDIITFQNRLQDYVGPHAKELEIVSLSDKISRLAGFGFAADPELMPTTKTLANSLGMDKETVLGVIEKLEGLKQETSDLLDMMSN